MKYIGSLDLGTTSVRCIIFNQNGEVISLSQKTHEQIYPHSGWVEHNPNEIYKNAITVINEAVKNANLNDNILEGIGITNQRETTVLWNKDTGEPFYNAIVWQDTRTTQICNEIQEYKNAILEKTGLPIATYFSATKVKWLIDNIPEIKKNLLKDNVAFGTIDTWLIWKLTGGKHFTDVTNASRTMLMNLETLDWDKELLKIFNIPHSILPKIVPSSKIIAYTKIQNNQIPIAAILGDQQAALFGHKCFNSGDAKNTYGTGCFLLMNTGSKQITSKNGLITTVAYQIENESVKYALEGSVAVAGSLVEWLKNNLGIISNAKEINEIASKVNDSGGVYFVPAFAGLFAPYWDKSARGTIVGLSHYVNKSHIARAALESVAFQTRDVFEAMIKDAKKELKSIKVDGGMTKSDILMQFQADILDINILRSEINEITALGAAFAAGLATDVWKDIKSLPNLKAKKFLPKMSKQNRENSYKNWKKAVTKSKGWL